MRGFDGLGRGLHEGVETVALTHKDHARIGAELAGAKRQRPGPACADLRAPCFQGARQDEDRIDRAELAIEGDGFGALRAKIEQRAATTKRAGEAHGLDQRVLDQCLTDIALAALDQAEHALGHAAAFDGGVHGFGDDLAGAGMGGGLDQRVIDQRLA